MSTSDWYTRNLAALHAAARAVGDCLDRFVDGGAQATAASFADAASAGTSAAGAHLPDDAALARLAGIFNLTSFEQDLLALCAATELYPALGDRCAAAHGSPHRNFPTFHLALSVLPNPHWDAMAADAPLRAWEMIEIGAGPTATLSPLRINERILHYLLGIATLDARLDAITERIQATAAPLPSHGEPAQRMANALAAGARNGTPPVIQMCGPEIGAKSNIAAGIAAALGLQPYRLSAHDLTGSAEEIAAIARLCEREAVLSRSLLFLVCNDDDQRQVAAAAAFLHHLRSAPVILATRESVRFGGRSTLRFELPKPTAGEQRDLWRAVLGAPEGVVDDVIDTLVAQFNLGADGIETIGADIAGVGFDDPERLAQRMWESCRVQARQELDDLAKRTMPRASWNDLVLPEIQSRLLTQLTYHVRLRMQVYERWGFAGKTSRGLGTGALFAGPSGTGKTLAAEVIANDLGLDLYHIDLSQVVSKYIGETEKNLRKIFDAAEEGGAVLLFDEADSLFGKRSEVKDSHDRHANIEVSYLLQRMESYRGLAILTTNMKSALDPAFLRRLRFVVDFPFPDSTQRAEMWRRVFPKDTPVEGLLYNKLANLDVTGGSIWNIALNAAFLAAEHGGPVSMEHVRQAAQIEYLKLEKQLTESETRGWV
ncbi:MAG TPA: ATP-binding protein [Candidatus Kapabacteria bacterium]|nr:ATP-binding protein [Candidatus Kapabacteria bacterium]